jgi:hypothetical protein
MPAGILNDLTGPDGFQSFGSLPFDGKTLWCGTGLAAFLVAAAAAFSAKRLSRLRNIVASVPMHLATTYCGVAGSAIIASSRAVRLRARRSSSPVG